MAEFATTFREPDRLDVSHGGSGLSWAFQVVVDGEGRRHLEGPEASEAAAAHSDLMRQACVFAQSEALHAGRVDY